MRTAAKLKLRGGRGVTFVFALVVFMAVVLFSAAMVTGSVSAAKNAALQQTEEQAYLSAISAARLVETYLADTGTVTDPVRYIRRVEVSADPEADPEDVTKVKYALGMTASEEYTLFPAESGAGEKYDAGTITGTKEALLYAICGLLQSDGDTATLTVTPPGAGMEAANVTLTRDTASNRITAVLTTPRGDLPAYQATLTFRCTEFPTTEVRYVTHEIMETVTDPGTGEETQVGTGEYEDHPVEVKTTIYRWTPETAQHGS